MLQFKSDLHKERYMKKYVDGRANKIEKFVETLGNLNMVFYKDTYKTETDDKGKESLVLDKRLFSNPFKTGSIANAPCFFNAHRKIKDSSGEDDFLTQKDFETMVGSILNKDVTLRVNEQSDQARVIKKDIKK